jgi:putative heme-binding domain-containing protein
MTPNVVLPKPSSKERARVVADYSAVANLKGAAEHGHELFKQQCATCHRLKGDGQEVGPDLAMTNDKPVDWLLTAIFDPNAAIEDRFKAQTVKLKAGGEVTGLISAETANNIVLKLPGGTELPVLRGDIASQQPSGRSLMPEGLESVIKPQDAADIIAWLRAR